VLHPREFKAVRVVSPYFINYHRLSVLESRAETFYLLMPEVYRGRRN